METNLSIIKHIWLENYAFIHTRRLSQAIKRDNESVLFVIKIKNYVNAAFIASVNDEEDDDVGNERVMSVSNYVIE